MKLIWNSISIFFIFWVLIDDTPLETWSYLTQQLQNKYSDLAYIHFSVPWKLGDGDFQHEDKASLALDPFRKIWTGPFVSTGGFIDPKKALRHAIEYPSDLVGFGRTFIANPDLVERIRLGVPLNKYNRATFYSQGIEGYTDYPFYSSRDETHIGFSNGV